VATWVVRLTRNVEVVGSSPIKGPRCFLEQETLTLLLSTGSFQERFRAWIHNRTKRNWASSLNIVPKEIERKSQDVPVSNVSSKYSKWCYQCVLDFRQLWNYFILFF